MNATDMKKPEEGRLYSYDEIFAVAWASIMIGSIATSLLFAVGFGIYTIITL